MAPACIHLYPYTYVLAIFTHIPTIDVYLGMYVHAQVYIYA
uniref:Uncharacterized protein n=1 Tax=Arundo donax TaxID=35708 RepID=A0A0A9TRF2_ARUDO